VGQIRMNVGGVGLIHHNSAWQPPHTQPPPSHTPFSPHSPPVCVNVLPQQRHLPIPSLSECEDLPLDVIRLAALLLAPEKARRSEEGRGGEGKGLRGNGEGLEG
jgi:hypothetical protein